jgi:hypothetical protein
MSSLFGNVCVKQLMKTVPQRIFFKDNLIGVLVLLIYFYSLLHPIPSSTLNFLFVCGGGSTGTGLRGSKSYLLNRPRGWTPLTEQPDGANKLKAGSIW